MTWSYTVPFDVIAINIAHEPWNDYISLVIAIM
jgi:hypothetical protein